MNFTPEQLELLAQGLSQYDFTKSVSLSDNYTLSDEKAQTYNILKNGVLECMKSNLPSLGFDRLIDNFVDDFPVKLLMNADASYIAEEATEILCNEEHTKAAIYQFIDQFSPVVECATAEYCNAKGKTVDDLNDDDVLCILGGAAKVINEELLSVLMQGQRFSEIINIANSQNTHEDFGDKFNADSINFFNKWTHCKTTTGAMLSIDDDKVKALSYEADDVSEVMRQSFCDTLDEIDVMIFHMREDGYTLSEIATRLGYKNHSAVAKRLKAMKKRWDKFTDTD